MSLSNLALTNTFTDQVTRVNQIVVELNRMLEGQYVTSGNVTILNSTVVGTVSLNVANGSVKTDRIELGAGAQTSPSMTRYLGSNSGIYFPATNTVALVTASNTIMTWANSGNVGIGITVPQAKLDVLGTINVTGRSTITGNVGIYKLAPAFALDVVGDIWATGNITAESDARVKEDIQPIFEAMKLLKSIHGVSYKKIKTKNHSYGVLAQDVQKVLPHAVSENDGVLGVNYQMLIPVLIEAVKELKTEISSIKKKE